MKVSELKQIIKEEIKIILSEGVPQEAKEKLFNRMKKKNDYSVWVMLLLYLAVLFLLLVTKF